MTNKQGGLIYQSRLSFKDGTTAIVKVYDETTEFVVSVISDWSVRWFHFPTLELAKAEYVKQVDLLKILAGIE